MVKILAGLAVLLAAPSVLGAAWQVCVEDDASLLTTPVRAAVLREFQTLVGSRVARIEFERCSVDSPRMRLAIKDEPPSQFEDVLGLAYRDRDRIEPVLHVFRGPLVRYLGAPNSSEAVGRAVARVAAHEATHFLHQQAHHCERGLMRATFPPYELASQDSRPFRRFARCRAVAARPGVLAEAGSPE